VKIGIGLRPLTAFKLFKCDIGGFRLRAGRFTSEREFDGYWQLSAIRMMICQAPFPPAKMHSDWLANNPGKSQ
jgi:hypothetical protein